MPKARPPPANTGTLMAMADWQPLPENEGLPPPAVKLGAVAGGKKIVLALTWIVGSKVYRIRTVTNTAYYKPDEWLSEEAMRTLEGMPGWEFTVDSPDYLGGLMALVERVLVPIPLVGL